jgi:membrane protease YdiL (CAAX protease family)
VRPTDGAGGQAGRSAVELPAGICILWGGKAPYGPASALGSTTNARFCLLSSPGFVPSAASAKSPGAQVRQAEPLSARHRPFRGWPRLKKPPWGPGSAILAVLASHAADFAIGLLLAAIGISYGVFVGATMIDALFIGFALALASRASVRLQPALFGLRRTGARPAVAWTVLALVATGAAQYGYARLFSPKYEHVFDTAPSVPVIGIVAVGVSAALFAPFAEELFYRGFVYGGLRKRLGVVPAVVVASFLFGFGHLLSGYNLGAAGGVAIDGVFLCALYEVTGSLWPSIALHSYIDGSSFAADQGRWGAALLVALVVMAIFLLYPSRRQLRFW